jgi:hypothetical protein
MNKQQAAEVAKGYFKNHNVDVFFITTDSQAFFDKQAAENHSNGKPNSENQVFEVTRADCDETIGEVVDLVKLSPEQALEKAQSKQAMAKTIWDEAQDAANAETNHLKKKSLQKKAEKAKANYEAAEQAVTFLTAQ